MRLWCCCCQLTVNQPSIIFCYIFWFYTWVDILFDKTILSNNHHNCNYLLTIAKVLRRRMKILFFPAQRNCNGPTAQLGGEEGIKAIHSYYPPVPGEPSQGPPPAIPLGEWVPNINSRTIFLSIAIFFMSGYKLIL